LFDLEFLTFLKKSLNKLGKQNRDSFKLELIEKKVKNMTNIIIKLKTNTKNI